MIRVDPSQSVYLVVAGRPAFVSRSKGEFFSLSHGDVTWILPSLIWWIWELKRSECVEGDILYFPLVLFETKCCKYESFSPSMSAHLSVWTWRKSRCSRSLNCVGLNSVQEVVVGVITALLFEKWGLLLRIYKIETSDSKPYYIDILWLMNKWH
jgi:hypothetical protein